MYSSFYIMNTSEERAINFPPSNIGNMPLRMKAVCDAGHSNSLLSTRDKHLIPAVSIKICTNNFKGNCKKIFGFALLPFFQGA